MCTYHFLLFLFLLNAYFWARAFFCFSNLKLMTEVYFKIAEKRLVSLKGREQPGTAAWASGTGQPPESGQKSRQNPAEFGHQTPQRQNNRKHSQTNNNQETLLKLHKTQPALTSTPNCGHQCEVGGVVAGFDALLFISLGSGPAFSRRVERPCQMWNLER